VGREVDDALARRGGSQDLHLELLGVRGTRSPAGERNGVAAFDDALVAVGRVGRTRAGADLHELQAVDGARIGHRVVVDAQLPVRAGGRVRHVGAVGRAQRQDVVAGPGPVAADRLPAAAAGNDDDGLLEAPRVPPPGVGVDAVEARVEPLEAHLEEGGVVVAVVPPPVVHQTLVVARGSEVDALYSGGRERPPVELDRRAARRAGGVGQGDDEALCGQDRLPQPGLAGGRGVGARRGPVRVHEVDVEALPARRRTGEREAEQDPGEQRPRGRNHAPEDTREALFRSERARIVTRRESARGPQGHPPPLPKSAARTTSAAPPSPP
jgi:hypothetical protein